MAKTDPVLLGRYHLEHLLARGGMAEVHLGRDRLLDRPVAIKLLYPHVAADAAFVERFRQEAKIAATLAHPNIVAVYDFGEADGGPVLVMEYVAGESLAQLLEREGRLSLKRALPIIQLVLTALAHAHARGLVHRDVKPSNILLARDGQIKLADFGIAQALTAATVTRSGQVLGSVHYLAPERLAGARATPAADCYAVGVTLYQMLTGRRPFEGDAVAAVFVQQLHQDPSPPSQVQSGLPTWVDRWVLRALAKDPTQRYDSATSMLAELDAKSRASDTTTLVWWAPWSSVVEPRRWDPDGAAAHNQQHVSYTQRTVTLAQHAHARPPRRRIPPALLPIAVLAMCGLAALYLLGSHLGGPRPGTAVQPNPPSTPGLAAGITAQPTMVPPTPPPATPSATRAPPPTTTPSPRLTNPRSGGHGRGRN